MKTDIFLGNLNTSEIEQKLKQNFEKNFVIIKKNDHRELNKAVSQKKKIFVLGGTPQMNAFAANSKKVSFLILPNNKKHAFDLQTAKKCAENNVKIGFVFSDFLKMGKYKKAKNFREIQKSLKLCNKTKIRAEFFSLSEDKNNLRKKEDMDSILKILKNRE